MSDTITVEPVTPSYNAVEDQRFLPGVDLDNPGSVARAIAMQIRTVGHYQGQPEVGGACIIASAAFGRLNLDQRIKFTNALREHLGVTSSGFSMIAWNDGSDTDEVVSKLESLPLVCKQ